MAQMMAVLLKKSDTNYAIQKIQFSQVILAENIAFMTNLSRKPQSYAIDNPDFLQANRLHHGIP